MKSPFDPLTQPCTVVCPLAGLELSAIAPIEGLWVLDQENIG
jgi:hypothetical protein